MAINASTFARKSGGEQNTQQRKPGFDYRSVVLRPIQGVWQLIDIKEVIDDRYPDPRYDNRKVSFVLVHIVPGAEKAETAEEQMKFRQRGHGKILSIECPPVVSPPGQRKNQKTGQMETISPSKLYSVLSVLLNDGEPLTKEQLGRADDATVKAWASEFNAALARRDLPKLAELTGATSEEVERDIENFEPLSDLATSRVMYAAAHLARTLRDLKAARPKVYATPETKVSGTTGSKYNRLPKLDSLVPEEVAETIPDYKPYPRPADPREADDDPNLVCENEGCGNRLRGYEKRDGTWVSNIEAAEHSRENYGGVYCGRCIHAMKQAAASDDPGF